MVYYLDNMVNINYTLFYKNHKKKSEIKNFIVQQCAIMAFIYLSFVFSFQFLIENEIFNKIINLHNYEKIENIFQLHH